MGIAWICVLNSNVGFLLDQNESSDARQNCITPPLKDNYSLFLHNLIAADFCLVFPLQEPQMFLLTLERKSRVSKLEIQEV